MKNNLQELLKWSIEHSDPNAITEGATDAAASKKVKDLDPAIIDAILGKSEATLMQENMTTILHPEADLENKLIAFDNLEMLVENIDNAKNLEPMKLWEPLIEQLLDKEAEIRKYAAWVIGTATQNNPCAQDSFLKHNGLVKVLHSFSSETVPENLKKMVYCLSCSVRHHKDSLNRFIELEGFNILVEKAKSSEIDTPVKARIAFMINSLIADDVCIIKLLSKLNYFNLLGTYLCETTIDDEDYVEKILKLLLAASPTLLQENIFPKNEKLHSRMLIFKELYPDILSSSDWFQLIQCTNTP